MRLKLTALLAGTALCLAACGRLGPGKAAPEFALKGPDGSMLKLSELRGKVVLLFFWASWAPPCRLMIPDLVRLQWKHDRRIFNVVAVAVDEGAREVSAFLKEANLNFPAVLCDETVKTAYFGNEEVKLPMILILNERGIILERLIGYHRSDSIASSVEKALNNISKD